MPAVRVVSPGGSSGGNGGSRDRGGSSRRTKKKKKSEKPDVKTKTGIGLDIGTGEVTIPTKRGTKRIGPRDSSRDVDIQFGRFAGRDSEDKGGKVRLSPSGEVKVKGKGESRIISPRRTSRRSRRTISDIRRANRRRERDRNIIEKGFGSLSRFGGRLRRRGFTQSVRGDKVEGGAKAFAGGALQNIGQTGLFFESAITEPVKTGKDITKGIGAAGSRLVRGKPVFPEASKVLRQEPGAVLGTLGSEAALDVVTGFAASKAFRGASKLARKTAAGLDPFTDVIKKADDTRVVRFLDDADIQSRGLLEADDISKQFGEVRLSDDIPGQKLSKQAGFAGEEVRPVSGQKGILGLRGETTISKPLPGKSSLSKSTKELLDKFDSGELKDIKNIRKLNEAIKAETGSKGLIERFFFADPSSTLRPKRLKVGGRRTTASLSDILTGDFTFRRPRRSQGLVFSRQRLADFPDRLSDIQKKLSKGEDLTPTQEARLIKFQADNTGKFKPIGALTGEREIVAAPGDILKKQKKLGTFGVEGGTADIIKTRLASASDEVRKILKKSDITSDDISKIASETGFSKADISSALGKGKPFLSPTGVATGTAGLVSGLATGTSKVRAKSKVPRPFSGSDKSFSSDKNGLGESFGKTSKSKLKRPKEISRRKSGRGRPKRKSTLTRPISGIRSTTRTTGGSSLISSSSSRRTGGGISRSGGGISLNPPIRKSRGRKLNKRAVGSKRRRRRAFTTQVKSKGKWKTISKDKPFGKALKAGATRVGKTLEASFRLTPSGTTTSSDNNFRLSKTGFRKSRAKSAKPLQFVERRSKRLDVSSEVSSIQKARKSSIKNKGSLIGKGNKGGSSKLKSSKNILK